MFSGVIARPRKLQPYAPSSPVLASLPCPLLASPLGSSFETYLDGKESTTDTLIYRPWPTLPESRFLYEEEEHGRSSLDNTCRSASLEYIDGTLSKCILS